MSEQAEPRGSVTFSAELFSYWILDHGAESISIIYRDGRRVSIPNRPSPSSNVAQTIFDWSKWWTFCVTARSDIIISEVFSPVASDKGRPAIYLDQNHWSTLALAVVDPQRVSSPSEFAAAKRLVDLAYDAGIVLPLSFCHLLETAAMFNSKRYDVGVTMASLSGGWQMRHPMVLMAAEVAKLAAEALGLPVPDACNQQAITLFPFACLPAKGSDALSEHEVSDWDLLKQALSSPAVLLDMLIDPQPIAKVEIEEWVATNQRITDYFGINVLSTAERNAQALRAFWVQNARELELAFQRLGVEPTQQVALAAWSARELRRRLRSLPFLSRYSRLHELRYLDQNCRWKRNDFNDMMYLAAAAAYADYVVAENHTGTQLRQIEKTKGNADPKIFTNLHDLVARLDTDGVRTAIERSG
jgi:hypothetical protein